MDEVFEYAFEYLSLVLMPIFCLTIVALANEIFWLVKKAVTVSKSRRRYR